jgi:uncharacterized membrane protein HdeD (DUF308 family)
MNQAASHYWWVYLLRGILSVILGALALLLPGITFTTLVVLLGAYMLAGGILSIVAAVSERRTMRSWGWYVFTGIISLIAGLLVFYNPFAAGTALIYLFAFWTLLAGIAEIATAIRLRKQIEGEGWYILLGILTIAFSLLILVNPAVGALTLSFMFGIFALVSGIMLLSLAIRLRKRHARTGELHHA